MSGAQAHPPLTELRADCENCFALCCVAPAFAASSDFAIDKPAGRPCPNLLADFRCGIHHELRPRGFPGCTVYDCFGAGQKVAQLTFGGRDWRQAPHTAGQMYDVFAVMRQLHELLWYLTEALRLQPDGPLHGELDRMLADTVRSTHGGPQELLQLDVAEHRQQVNALLLRTSESVRAGRLGRGLRGPDHRGADLIGARLAGADLRGASLRGAFLIGADLRNADLRHADVIGADFRNADIRGADFTGALFLLQSQLDAAIGDTGTTVPVSFVHPAHWSQRSQWSRDQ